MSRQAIPSYRDESITAARDSKIARDSIVTACRSVRDTPRAAVSSSNLAAILDPLRQSLAEQLELHEEFATVQADSAAKALDIVKAAVKKRDQETSKRWQANFDFAHALKGEEQLHQN